MYIDGTKEHFESMLRSFEKVKKVEGQTQGNDFSDFDDVVEEVSRRPFSRLS